MLDNRTLVEIEIRQAEYAMNCQQAIEGRSPEYVAAFLAGCELSCEYWQRVMWGWWRVMKTRT